MKLSVSMWSVVHPVRAGQMDLAGFVDFVAGQDAEGVELLDYFWKDKESELPKVKKQIADAGLELAVYSVGNDFFQPDRAVWEQQLADMKTGIDTANALEVVRLDPEGGEKSMEDMAAHAARIAIQGVYYTYYCTQSGAGQAPNNIRPPMSSAAFGGMATQWGTKGNLCLEEDDALIVRCNAAGAQFRNLTLTDAFHMSIEYWQRTSSFNHVQMAADEDGDFTFVIAHRDPGIHNWLDTGGLRRTIFGQRWQAFDRSDPHDDPWMTVRQVRFSDLDAELPDGVRRIDAAGRAAQIDARSRGFARRFAED